MHKCCLPKWKNKIKHLKENKIICCQSVGDSFLSDDEEKYILEKTIHDLTDDSEQKNKYIRKLREENKLFIQEAIKTEDELNVLIKRQEKIISDLNEQIIELKKFNKESKKVTKTMSSQTQQTVKSVSTSTDIKRNVINSCDIQGEPCEVIKLKRACSVNDRKNMFTPSRIPQKYVSAKQNIFLNNLDNDIETNRLATIINNSVPEESLSSQEAAKTGEARKLNKVLLLCDDFGRNINKILSKNVDMDNFRIESIYKPGATFQQVIESIEPLTRTYSLEDHVIILAGSNNFNKKTKYPLFKDICNKLKMCTNLNISIATVATTMFLVIYLY